MAGWCPDIGQHVAPLIGMNALEARNMFSGLPAWQLAHWACMAGAFSEKVLREASTLPENLFWHGLDHHLAQDPGASRLAGGETKREPAPGIAALLRSAQAAGQAALSGRTLSGRTPRGRKRATGDEEDALGAGAAGSRPPGATRGSPSGSPRTVPYRTAPYHNVPCRTITCLTRNRSPYPYPHP